MASKQQIIQEINAYMQQFPNAKNSSWYVGIAADARKRLFNDHNVDEKNGLWIYRMADSSSAARDIEAAYHEAGCKGGPGGGDYTTVYVYAYLITSLTVE